MDTLKNENFIEENNFSFTPKNKINEFNEKNYYKDQFLEDNKKSEISDFNKMHVKKDIFLKKKNINYIDNMNEKNILNSIVFNNEEEYEKIKQEEEEKVKKSKWNILQKHRTEEIKIISDNNIKDDSSKNLVLTPSNNKTNKIFNNNNLNFSFTPNNKLNFIEKSNNKLDNEEKNDSIACTPLNIINRIKQYNIYDKNTNNNEKEKNKLNKWNNNPKRQFDDFTYSPIMKWMEIKNDNIEVSSTENEKNITNNGKNDIANDIYPKTVSNNTKKDLYDNNEGDKQTLTPRSKWNLKRNERNNNKTSVSPLNKWVDKKKEFNSYTPKNYWSNNNIELNDNKLDKEENFTPIKKWEEKLSEYNLKGYKNLNNNDIPTKRNISENESFPENDYCSELREKNDKGDISYHEIENSFNNNFKNDSFTSCYNKWFDLNEKFKKKNITNNPVNKWENKIKRNINEYPLTEKSINIEVVKNDEENQNYCTPIRKKQEENLLINKEKSNLKENRNCNEKENCFGVLKINGKQNEKGFFSQNNTQNLFEKVRKNKYDFLNKIKRETKEQKLKRNFSEQKIIFKKNY